MQEKLLILRKKRGISQKQLAKEIGITQKQFSKKENGQTRFYIDEGYRIAKYLGVNLWDIFLPSTYLKDNKKLKEESSTAGKQTLDSNK